MTIFHKSILTGACEVTSNEHLYHCIMLQKDGTVVSANEHVRFIAQSSQQQVYKTLPFGNANGLMNNVAITADQILNLVKMIPVDRQFKGMLEHVDISMVNGNTLSAIFNDGHGEANFTLRASNISPVLANYKNLLQALGLSKLSQKELLINRSELENIFAALQAACKYNGKFSFIQQRAFDKGYVWRCINELTGQAILIIFTLTESDIKTEFGHWENSLFTRKVLTRCIS